MIDGILLINKEQGVTSYDVLRKLKRVFPKGQKIGHGGTLDPFATGVLIVLLGKGTKLMERIHLLEKRYVVVAEFGYATDTQDINGSVIERKDNLRKISFKEIDDCITRNFLGKISQMPPIYSAKKIRGVSSYKLARKGVVVELKPKVVNIKRFEIKEYDWPRVSFDITCSTGTYVRTLVHDLGHSLNTCATAISLCRESIGSFVLEDAYPSKDIVDSDIIEKVINLEIVDI